MSTEPLGVWLAAGAAAGIAALVTSLAVPLAAGVARVVRAVDYPGGRRDHGAAIPRLGGLAILAGLVLGAGSVALVIWPQWGARVARSELGAMVAASALVALVGLTEDLIGVSPLKRFAVETVAASLMVAVGWSFSVVALPGGYVLELGAWGKVISVVWIVGVTNAINLMDGLDGLAAGVIAIIATSLAVFTVGRGNVMTVVLLGAMAGSCLGFLRHNWAPARIFMGDAGSLTLGFLLGLVTVHDSLKAPAAVAILVPLLALGVPVFDTLLVMAVRFFRGGGGGLARRVARVFRADRTHLHHLLAALAPHRRLIVVWIYLMVLVGCAGAVWVAVSGSATVGYTLLAIEAAAVAVVRWAGLSRQARQLAALRREEARELLASVPGEGNGVS